MMDQCPKDMLSTVAGCGEPGHDGDGSLATAACLNEPKNLCFDAEGNLYIADSENHAIRRVMRSSGLIETVAGFVAQPLKAQENPPPSVMSEESLEDVDPLADVDRSHGLTKTLALDLGGR